jgi:large subunit ribosomal protein L24
MGEKYSIKKNDTVKVISGKDKGKTGRVLQVNRESGRVMVEGINLVKKAVKKKSQQDRGGIIEVESPLHISNVMLTTKGGKRTRVGYKTEGKTKERYAKKGGETL